MTSNNQDLTQLNMIPSFGESGRTLSETERKEMIRRKGLCRSCGLVKVTESSANLFRRKNKIITNEDVWEGICIRCNRDRVPDHVAAEWNKRNDRRSIAHQQSARTFNTSRNNLSSSSRRRVAPRRIQSERVSGQHMSSSSSLSSRRPLGGGATSTDGSASFRELIMSPDDISHKHGGLREMPPSLRLPKTPDTNSNRKLVSSFRDTSSSSLSTPRSMSGQPTTIKGSSRKKSVASMQEELKSLRSKIVYEGLTGVDSIPYLEKILVPGSNTPDIQSVAGQVLWILAAANALNASSFSPPNASSINHVMHAFGSCIDIPDSSVGCILHSIRSETLEWGSRCLHRHVGLVEEFNNENSYKFVSTVMEESVDGSTALLWAGQFILTMFDHFEAPATLADPSFSSFLLTVLQNRVASVSSVSHDLLLTLLEVLTHILESADPKVLDFDLERCCSVATRAIDELSMEDERVAWAGGRFLAVVISVAKPNDLHAISASAIVESLICAMNYQSVNPLFISVVGHALWKLTSVPDLITMVEVRPALAIISNATEKNRGRSDHRDLSLSLCAIVSNICTLPGAQMIDLPVSMLGDAITHHPSDPTVCDYAFRSLSRIVCLFPDGLESVLGNLERPNIVVAFSVTPPTSDADIVAMVSSVKQSPLPDPLANLLSQLIRRMGARLQYLRDPVRLKELLRLTSSLATCGVLKSNPQVSLIVRKLERIVNDQQLDPRLRADCCTLLRDLLVHSDAQVSLSNILSALQHLTGLHDTSVDVAIISLLYAVASKSTQEKSRTSMCSLLVRILHKHNHVDAPYESEIFELGSGTFSVLCSGSKFQVGTSDIGSIAESAYKVLESNKSDSNTIANFLSALLVFCEDALDAVFESGTIVMVNDAMNDIQHCESIQEIGCAILARVTVVESMDMFLIILQTDGLKALAGALEHHGNNHAVRSTATEALRRLSSLSAIVPELDVLGIVNKFVPLLKEHETDTYFCVNAMQLLGYMADSGEPFQKTPDSEVVNACFDLLRSNPDSPDIFYHCLAYMRLFNLECLSTQSRNAWTHIMFEALDKFLGISSICVVALELLRHLYSGAGSERLPEMNADRVYNATLALIDNPAVAKAGLALLASLDETTNNPQLFTVVIMVLYIFHENEELAALALDLLQGGLTESNEWTGYEVDAVVNTLAKFVDSFAIQRRSTSVLYLVWQQYRLLLQEREEQLVPLLTLVHETFNDQDCGAMAQSLLEEI